MKGIFSDSYLVLTPSNIPVSIKLGQTTVVLIPDFFNVCNS